MHGVTMQQSATSSENSSSFTPATGIIVLPTLCNLRVEEPISGPLLDAKESSIASQRPSGRHVTVFISEDYTVSDAVQADAVQAVAVRADSVSTKARTSVDRKVDPIVGLNNWLQRSPEGNVTRHFTWAMAQTGPSDQAVYHATAKCRYNFQRSKS